VTESGALVAGPSVSISPTIPPLASSRLISPEAEEEFCTVKVCVPACAEVKSCPQAVLVTVTVEEALLAVGSAAIVVPAASAGTATSTPATTQVRCPASRSQWPGPAGTVAGTAAGFSPAGVAVALRDAGATAGPWAGLPRKFHKITTR
jgi:hypothetical protein